MICKYLAFFGIIVRMRRILLCLMAASANIYAADTDYQILWDIHFSPYAGGEDLLYATRLIDRTEAYFFKKAQFEPSKSARDRSYRLTELIAFWLPLNYEAMLVQHEVFGHGFRIRSSEHTQVAGYRLQAPPPYGPGGGATSYWTSPQMTSTEETAISGAGVEATAILANLTKFKWLAHRLLDAKQSVLYLLCQHDLSEYIGSMKTVRKQKDDTDGHDIHAYLLWLNRTYPQNHLSSSRLRSLSWINLFDPFTYFSIWSWFHYISSGRDTKIPMIPLWSLDYLFGARLGLTPFGPEIFWENYFSGHGKVYYCYLKSGRHANHTYFGAGVYCPAIWSAGKWDFGLRIDGWRQPQLMLKSGSIPFDEMQNDAPLRKPLYSSSELNVVRWGAAMSFLAEVHINETYGFVGEAGAKTRGFLPGYSLWGSPVIRLGFSTRF